MAATEAVPSLEALLEESSRSALPVGWEGGKARHSGGTIVRREFLHRKHKRRVEYDVNAPGVTIASVKQQEGSGVWMLDEVLRTINAKREPSQFEAAIRLMELSNLGQI